MALDTSTITSDLQWLWQQCDLRCMLDGAKFAAETLFWIQSPNCADTSEGCAAAHQPNRDEIPDVSPVHRRFALSLIRCREYLRAADFLKNKNDPYDRFLHFYASFLAGEKAKLESLADAADKSRKLENDDLDALHRRLDVLHSSGDLDPFLKYVYGLVLKEQGLVEQSKTLFSLSVNECPRFWPAWLELSKAVTRDDVSQIALPSHWMRTLYRALAYGHLNANREAFEMYESLREINPNLGTVPFVVEQMATQLHALREHDGACDLLDELREREPYRMEGMHTYSSTLFIKRDRVRLSALAHHCFSVDKYRPETCIVAGNLFALREERDRSVAYFQRALRLDPRSVDAWTLLGHEFMELKNTAAACVAYRAAVDVEPNDYRAWYALGQMYEILRMPSHAAFYYNVAHRPEDSRMLMALGDIYTRMADTQPDRSSLNSALRCYWRARCVGDIEGSALIKLGMILEKTGKADAASEVYAKYLSEQKLCGEDEEPDELNDAVCYRFLANYCLEKGKIDEAHHYATECLQRPYTKEMGRIILKRLSALVESGSGPSSLKVGTNGEIDSQRDGNDMEQSADESSDRMPLPAVLLARLKKRGIIKADSEQQGENDDDLAQSQEEVIAESYDDDGAQYGKRRSEPPLHAAGCPNKSNPFHQCSQYCFDRYGSEDAGMPENRLPKKYLALRKVMLAKYPLPDGWKEVYDPGVAHHYYWNPESNEVCWVSPTHPKAVIGDPAPLLAKSHFERLDKAKLDALVRATATGASKRQARLLGMGSDEWIKGADGDDSDEDRGGTMNKRKRYMRPPGQTTGGKGALDPMDPASYGECEPGKWSSGLEQKGDAKTGVDVTATGPLFQSRPYPNPGAILRQNAEIKGKVKK